MAKVELSTLSTDAFTFYTTVEYWTTLQKKISSTKRGDRVAMMVMDFNLTDSLIETVFDELVAAAGRGVETWLSVDAHTFMFNHEPRNLSQYWVHNDIDHLSKRLLKKSRRLQELAQQPTGHVAIINKPTRGLTNPVAGRSHTKTTIINDYVFVGGCNFQHSESIDLMVGWHDKKIANQLYGFVTSVIKHESTNPVLKGVDSVTMVDQQTTLIIDAGIKNQSTILKEALQLIDEAEKSILITCQYFPNSLTAKHLAAAHNRGVEVEVIYAHPSVQGHFGGLGQWVSILRERTRVPAELFQKMIPKSGNPLHAKLVATDKGAIIGSHNYVKAGVLLGTCEIALIRHDADFSKQAVAALRRELPN